MLEMPYHLRTLPTESLGLLRHFASAQESEFGVDELMALTGLSERGFGKAIRGLVTKQFVDMVSEGTYKLSNKGKRAVIELREWEGTTPNPAAANTTNIPTSKESTATDSPSNPAPATDTAPRFVNRTLVVAAPRTLLSGQPTAIYIGFNDPNEANLLVNSADLLLRITAIDGDGSMLMERETPFRLGNRAARQILEITGGAYTLIRLRVQVCQPGADEIDIDASDCPGMYVDLSVTDIVEEADLRLAAYSANFLIHDEP